MALIYHFVPLPKSIFRYTYIFPSNIENKITSHSKLYSGNSDYKTPDSVPSFIKELSLKNVSNDKFYSLLANKLCSTGLTRMSRRPIYIPTKKHPKVMQKLIDSNKYIIRNELIEKIKKL